MIHSKAFQQLSLLAVTLLSASALLAEDAFYRAQPKGSSIRIEGTSTVHDWHVEGSLIGGAMEIPPGFPLDKSLESIPKPEKAPGVRVMIPVRNLASSGGKPMDNVMLQAMKASDYPMIAYTLKEISPKNGGRKAGEPVQFDSTGDLTIAGVTKSVSLPVTMEVLEDGKNVKVTGETKVKMTDFKIDPPAPKVALGFIKTGDEVTIKFEWMTVKK